jgi:hypothetical protein
MTKTVILLLAACLTLPATAQAKCKKIDVGGHWALYATLASSSEYWSICRIDLNSTGRLEGGKSYCQTAGEPRSNIYAGEFTVKRNCRLKGFFAVSGDTQTFDSAWMSPNKQMFTGVGHNSSENFAFTAVRKSQ